ncbi:MAG: hypothetical protein WC905_03365 [Patescibacteria group bacterium]|jgi:hypothetical protein
MKKQIFIVLSGDGNPNTTKHCQKLKIWKKIVKIAEAGVLPEKPAAIISGTGTRHLDTANMLRLKPTAYSLLCGGAEEVPDDTRYKITLTDKYRTEIPRKKWMTPSTWQFLKELPDQTILITGPEFFTGLMIAKAKKYRPGSVVKIIVTLKEGVRDFFDVEKLKI